MKSKTALIKGATDGIGKALALKLLQENFKVVIIGRNQRKVEATVHKLKDRTFSYSRERKPIRLEIRDGDTESLLSLTETLLKDY